MRTSRIMSLLGWLLALVATAACVVLALVILDMRAKERLTTVQFVSPRSATELPPNWDGDKTRVLLVGDSRIRRWPTLPTSEDVVFAKSGIGGETLGQLERRFDRDVLDITPAPDAIIIAAGINDLVAASIQRKFGPKFRAEVSRQMLERMAGLAKKARRRGIDVHIATIIQPAAPDLVRRLTYWDDNLYGLVSDANAQIAEITSGDDIEMIDFNAMLDGSDGPLPEKYSADTLHFSADAYSVLNDQLTRGNSFK